MYIYLDVACPSHNAEDRLTPLKTIEVSYLKMCTLHTKLCILIPCQQNFNHMHYPMSKLYW